MNELYLSGEVGDYGWDDDFSAKVVNAALKGVDGDVTIRLNSNGGIVLEGFAIYNAIKSHPGKVTVIVDVIAASIASYIAMAADTVLMHKNSKIMIHSPWNEIQGDAPALRQAADELDMLAETLVGGYHEKTKIEKAELKEMVANTTWLSAEQAIALGFADGYAELPAKASYPSTAVARLKSSIKTSEIPESVRGHFYEFVKSQEVVMAKVTEETRAEEATPDEIIEEVVDIIEAVEDGEEVEVSDLEEIIELIESLGEQVDDPVAFIREAVQNGLTLKQAQAKIQDTIAMKKEKPVRRTQASAQVAVGTSGADRSIKAIKNALHAKAGVAPLEAKNPYSTASLFELAKASAEASGANTAGMSKDQVFKTAMFGARNQGYTRSDFPELLTGTTNLIFMNAFNEVETNYQDWTRKISLQDGRLHTFAGLGPISDLKKIAEGADYPELKQGSGAETMQLHKEGGFLTITREMILDDAVGAFTDNPRKAGHAAKRNIQRSVTGILVNNPTMGDGVALFHNTHGNLISGGSSALSITSLNSALLKMRQQTDPTTGANFYIQPKFLIVPPQLESTAKLLMASLYDPNSPATPIPNTVNGLAEVIVDVTLTDATAWYLVADGRVEDVVGIGYRDGNDAPYLEEVENPRNDTLALKIRLEYAVAPLHYAGMVKSAGK